MWMDWGTCGARTACGTGADPDVEIRGEGVRYGGIEEWAQGLTTRAACMIHRLQVPIQEGRAEGDDFGSTIITGNTVIETGNDGGI